MTALDECHARGFLWKAVGMCNDVKRDVTACLRAERLDRTRVHREKALENRKKFNAIWKDIDENR